MNRMKSYFGFVIMGLMLSSCASVYSPSIVNAPLFSEEGEVQIQLQTGTGGTGLQGAFAIDYNLGFIGNFNYLERNNIDGDKLKHAIGELGFGYFVPQGHDFKFEIFGGYGYGFGSTRFSGNSSLSNNYDLLQGNYHKLFIQADVGIPTDYFDIGLSFRDANALYFNGKGVSNGNVTYFKENASFLESVLFTRFGYKYVKFTAQMGLSLPLNNAQHISQNYYAFMFNIGVYVAIRDSFKKEKSPPELPPIAPVPPKEPPPEPGKP